MADEEFSELELTSAGSLYTVKVSFLSMIKGLLVLLLPVVMPLVSDRGETDLKQDRAGLAASVFVNDRLVGGEETSEPLGILCFETSGEVLGLGFELSSWPEWGLLLKISIVFGLGYEWN